MAPTRPGFDSRIGNFFAASATTPTRLAGAHKHPRPLGEALLCTSGNLASYLCGKFEFFALDDLVEIDCRSTLLIRTVEKVAIQTCLDETGDKSNVVKVVLRLKDKTGVRSDAGLTYR